MSSDSAAPAHFILPTIGSAGDVLPFVGIGSVLRRRGHRVTIVTGDYFEPLIRRAGLDFVSIATVEQYLEQINHPDLWHPLRAAAFVMRAGIAPLIRPVFDVIAQLHEPGRTVVAGSSLALGIRAAQDALGVPTASVHLQPALFRSLIQPAKLTGIFTPPWMPRRLIALQHRLADKLVVDRLICPALNELRSELGLPPVDRVFNHYLHSPQLVLAMYPEWFAPPQSDWPPNVRQPGFPLYDELDVTPLESELAEWLDAGEPPIAFTPGTAMLHGAAFFAAAADACRRSRRRGLLLTRHPEQLPTSLPAGVRHVAFAPFSQLLPRCAALVHHGGVGTMSQALAAGVPQVVMPMAHDQPDNAGRAERLGVSATLPPRHFRGPRLASVLNELLTSQSTRAACRATAEKFAGIHPLKTAATLLEGLLPER